MQLSGALMWENEQCGVSEIFSCLRRHLVLGGTETDASMASPHAPKKTHTAEPSVIQNTSGLGGAVRTQLSVHLYTLFHGSIHHLCMQT